MTSAALPLYNRQIIVTVGDLQISSVSEDPQALSPSRIHSTLRVAFRVESTTDKEPNKAELSIWNLASESRKKLQEDKDVLTRIEAGYAGQVFVIFIGDLTYAHSARQGPDWVTTLQAGDGAKQFRTARINESLGPGTTVIDAAKRSADALGLPLGNFLEKINKGNLRGVLDSFPRGITLSGKAEEQFDKMMRLLGYEWFILDGQVQVMEPLTPVNETLVKLDAESGLVGSPEKGEKGVIKVRSLLQPDLSPGRKLVLDGIDTKGTFRIERSVWFGDTWAQDWYVEAECRPI